MTRTVYCAYLKREAPGLDYAPWPGELGQRIFREISVEAWQKWLAYQTALINENRLSPMDPANRKYLTEQMQKFLFEGTADKVAGLTPES